jgi:hypothetical protein
VPFVASDVELEACLVETLGQHRARASA